jgi:hypothetical protein
LNIFSKCNDCGEFADMRFFNNCGRVTKTCFKCDYEELVFYDDGKLFFAMQQSQKPTWEKIEKDITSPIEVVAN